LKLGLIILAAGLSRRMGHLTPKPFLDLGGKLVIFHSLDFFSSLGYISDIVVVAKEIYHPLFPSNIKLALPGKERQDSLRNGFNKLKDSCDWVISHDAARPFLYKTEINKLIDNRQGFSALALGSKVKNSLKIADSDGTLKKSIDRSNTWEVFTPQLIEYALLKKGLEYIQQNQIICTDELSIAEIYNVKSKIIETDKPNIKITEPRDLELVKLIFEGYRG
jgi:2-C-methyl-D-erythritol 4-phosphate cytidylyltransferase